MPITISYGNPALVGAASFAIGRERGKLKAGAQAARMAQGMLDRRDRSMERERDRNDRLGVLGAQMQQRERMNQQGLIGDERNRQQRGQIEQARLAQRDADRAANQGRYDQGRADSAAKRQQDRDYQQWLQGKQAYDAWQNTPDSPEFPRGPAPPDPGPPPTIPTPSGGGSPYQTLPGAPVDPISGGSQPYVPVQSANPLGGRGQQGRDDRTLTINEMYASGAAPNDSGFFLGTDKRNWAHTQKGPNQYLQDLGGGVYRRRTRRPGSAGYVDTGSQQMASPGVYGGANVGGTDVNVMPGGTAAPIGEPYTGAGSLDYAGPEKLLGYTPTQDKEMAKLWDARGRVDGMKHLDETGKMEAKQKIDEQLASFQKSEIPESLQPESMASKLARTMLNPDAVQGMPLSINPDGTWQLPRGYQAPTSETEKKTDARLDLIKNMSSPIKGADGTMEWPDPDKIAETVGKLIPGDVDSSVGSGQEPWGGQLNGFVEKGGFYKGPVMDTGSALTKAEELKGQYDNVQVIRNPQNPSQAKITMSQRPPEKQEVKADEDDTSIPWDKWRDSFIEDESRNISTGIDFKKLPYREKVAQAREAFKLERQRMRDERNKAKGGGLTAADIPGIWSDDEGDVSQAPQQPPSVEQPEMKTFANNWGQPVRPSQPVGDGMHPLGKATEFGATALQTLGLAPEISPGVSLDSKSVGGMAGSLKPKQKKRLMELRSKHMKNPASATDEELLEYEKLMQGQ